MVEICNRFVNKSYTLLFTFRENNVFPAVNIRYFGLVRIIRKLYNMSRGSCSFNGLFCAGVVQKPMNKFWARHHSSSIVIELKSSFE